jgi:hypothetical protein
LRHNRSFVCVYTKPSIFRQKISTSDYRLTIGVDNWEDVEVVFVQEGLCKVVAGLIAINELLGNVLQSLCTISITVFHLTRPRTGATIHSRA